MIQPIVFEPIETSKIYTQVISQILSLIREGALNAGDQLPPETQLADQLGVSRSSVREALRALEILGVIESKAGVGSFVKGLPSMNRLSGSLHDLVEGGSPMEIIEARKTLEPEIVYLAAVRRDEEQLVALRQNLDLMAGRTAAGESTMEVDIEFHQLLASVCRNPVLADCMGLIVDRMRRRFWHDTKEASLTQRGRAQTYLAHHRELLKAVEAKEPGLAAEIMLKHLQTIEDSLQE